MPGSQIPVACVQTRAHDRAEFATTWPRILAAADRAARDGAKLVVLPEGTVPAYVLGDAPIDERQLARAQSDVARIARAHGVTIVYGGAKIVDAKTLNAAIVVGPTGDELGFAAKQFLWHFDRRWFAAGSTLEPIDTPIGKLGLLVCADGRIPSIAATLVERGARVLVMPTAWVTSGRDPGALENIQADLMANVRARENGVPFVVANKCGVELRSVAYCGKSAIVDASGTFVSRANERDETTIFGTISLDRQRTVPARPIAVPATSAPPAPARLRARIAFAFASADDVESYARLAAQADADVFVTFGTATGARGTNQSLPRIALGNEHPLDELSEVAGLRYALVSAPSLHAPRGLVPARLSGIDLFICRTAGDPDWSVRVARTRAAELRAFAIVFDAERERAFAVDPDGVVVAGTFGDFALAAFAYDGTRTAATTVAPRTDVLEGLRVAESLRADRSTLHDARALA